jgi:alkyl hydroperoxide reductase subunit D
MHHIDALRGLLPDAAKDLNLNLSSVLSSELLTKNQAWGIALTCAYFVRNTQLRDAVLHDARTHVSEAIIDDAKAAASIMGMNTMFYRFRHLVGKESYAHRPARLRMTRMARPASSKAEFELFSLACAVLAGCEMCVKAHEASILKEGLTEDHVHETVRIAAVINGVAVALSV